MFTSLLSAIDWSPVQEFITKWMDNELAFYLGIGGIALLLIAILAFILAGSYKHRAKKKAKKSKNENKQQEAAPVAPKPAVTAPVAQRKPAPVVAQAPTPVAAPYVAPVTASEVAPYTAPVYTEPAEETIPYTAPYEAPEAPQTNYYAPAEAEPEITAFQQNEPEVEPVFNFAPAPVEAEPEVQNYESPAEAEPVDDSSWKSAKLNVKTKKVAPVEEAPSEEPAPVKKAAPKKAAAPKAAPAEKKPAAKKAAPAKAAPKAAPVEEAPSKAEKPKVVGKYTIENSGYAFQFCLFANNGQLLYESREYASAASCKGGIETFKKNIPDCEYRVDVDKNGGYKYIFKKGNSLYIGETYSTQKAAERSAESVKRFVGISELAD